MDQQEEFLKEVATIFEENCLHLVIRSQDIEKCLIFSTNYCLDYKHKKKTM